MCLYEYKVPGRNIRTVFATGKMYFWSAEQLYYNLWYFIFVYTDKQCHSGWHYAEFLSPFQSVVLFTPNVPIFQSSTDIYF